MEHEENKIEDTNENIPELVDEINILEIEQAKGKVESRDRKALYDSEEIVIKGDTVSEISYILLGAIIIMAIVYFIFWSGGDSQQSDMDITNAESEATEVMKWQEELLSGILQTDFTSELLEAIAKIQMNEYIGIELLIEGLVTYDDEYIKSYIYEELDKYTRYEAVTKEVEYGDMVNIDYEIVLNGQVVEDLSITDYDLKLGSGKFILGVEESLVGASKGSNVSVPVTFPEDSSIEELAGESTTVIVTINEVFDEIKLELVDENVAYLSPTAKSINEYIDELKVELEEGSYDLSDGAVRAQVWDKFTAGVTVEYYPDEAIGVLIDKKKQVYIDQAESEKLTFEYFLKTKDMTESELDEYLEKSARQEYLEKLAVYYLIGIERLVPEQEEYDRMLNQLLQESGFATLKDAEAIGYEISDIEYTMLKEIALTWLTDRTEIITDND